MSSNLANEILARLEAGRVSSPELEQALRVSQSAVGRKLRALIDLHAIVRIGSRRGARYAALRSIEGIGSSWPLRRIDENSKIQTLGVLSALAAGEYYFEAAADLRNFVPSGISSDLPYFLQDQRPAGFLGRAVPLRYPELKLPQRVVDWTDDHYLSYLTQRGADNVGDLILGDDALNAYLISQRDCAPLTSEARATTYPKLATEVMEGGLPGSSAHGEHPKFTALITDEAGYRHVLVKFSPPVGTAIGQRWSDLLIAEHHAHVVLREAGVNACQSRIDRFGDRTYLEVDRFDRSGRDGRIGVTSLYAIDAHLHGALDNWLAAATRLHRDRRIDLEALETIRLLSTFGALIANTDRHFGNLAFFDHYDGNFTLAPVYDMLPMRFAPEHDQLVARIFTPPSPTAETLAVFGQAHALAVDYWSRLAEDPRISTEFRAMGGTCRGALLSLPLSAVY
jgi:hypothetical protein